MVLSYIVNMQNVIKKTKNYEESLCFSLISYARKNPLFYSIIKDRVSRFSLTGEGSYSLDNYIEALEPVDEYMATRRLDWIVNESKFPDMILMNL